MSVSSLTPSTASDTTLDRLVVETAKYLGASAGDSIPEKEVIAQAEANGYSEHFASKLLANRGAHRSGQVEVPEQGDLFGDLWSKDPDYTGVVAKSPNSTHPTPWSDRPETRENGCGPEPIDNGDEDYHYLHEPISVSVDCVDKERYLHEDGTPFTAMEAVNSYIEQRYGENTTATRHGFVKGRQYYAEQQYKRGMALDRQWLDQYDNPSTVLLSLRASPTPDGRLSLLHELGDALSETLHQIRYRLQYSSNAPFDSEDWAYFAVFAGTRKRATPHAHIMVYCSDDVDRDLFIPVVEKFVERCDYSPKDMRGNDPEKGTISIRGNGPDSIPTVDDSRRFHKEGVFDGENSQGAVYALTQLPHLEDVDRMAKDELLHSSTVDAWSSKPFRCSQTQIDDSYLATTPV